MGAQILSLPGIALTTGSACNSGAQEPSYVLKEIGLSHDEANHTLRIGLGRFNTKEDIQIASEQIIKAARTLKPDLFKLRN